MKEVENASSLHIHIVFFNSYGKTPSQHLLLKQASFNIFNSLWHIYVDTYISNGSFQTFTVLNFSVEQR